MANGLFNLKQVMQAVQQSAWVAQKPPSVEYLVVAGGGGGSGYAPGGAGGLLQGIDLVPSGQTLLVTVGAGGAVSNNGANSVFGSVTSVGGGRPAVPPVVGGSGGGGPNGPVGNSIGQPGQGTAGQGNAGGYGRDTGASYYGGGGGGAGTTGYAANNGTCGTGGAGIASVISGTVTAYAGGGGGGHAYGGGPGAGGVGGGGAGGDAVNPTPANGYPGTANTGGGGGAASYNGVGANAAAGGSGIVIISYPDVYAAAASSSGATVSTSGSGSLLLNSGSYVKYPNNAAFTLAGDFTIEGFFNTTSTANPYFWSLGDDATSAGLCLYYSSAGGVLRVYTNGGAPLNGVSILSNTWYHLSLVRSGGGTNNVVLYVNGTSAGSMTNTATFNGVAGNGFVVGAEYGGGVFGTSPTFYSSNIRVVKGTAIVPPAGGPTAPLTPVTNTSFLMNTVSGAYLVDSSSSSLTATVVNTSAWNASSPFTGTGYKNRVYTWTSSGSITF